MNDCFFSNEKMAQQSQNVIYFRLFSYCSFSKRFRELIDTYHKLSPTHMWYIYTVSFSFPLNRVILSVHTKLQMKRYYEWGKKVWVLSFYSQTVNVCAPRRGKALRKRELSSWYH